MPSLAHHVEIAFFMNRYPCNASQLGVSAGLLVALFVGCEQSPTGTLESGDALLAASGESKSDVDLLQGYWENNVCSLSVSGNSLFYIKGDEWYQTEFTLPPATDPKQLHATILADGTGSDRDIGTKIIALYEIEDETLTLVALTEGAPMDSLDTFESLGRYVVARAKPKEGRTSPPPQAE